MPIDVQHVQSKCNKTISTWLYLEGIEEDGEYPQVPGRSSSRRFHRIYKRCLVTFFLSARRFNEDARLILFSNVDFRWSDSSFDKKLTSILQQIGVEFIVLSYTHIPPIEQKQWRNQFFVIDVLQHLSINVTNEDLVLIMDSDIIWSGDSRTQSFWDELRIEGSLTMLPIDDRLEKINGFNLEDLQEVSKLFGAKSKENIQYAGGELIGLRGDKLIQVSKAAEEYWSTYSSLLKSSKIKFIEEAHFLSTIYHNLGITFGNADQYIRRIWTQSFHYSNRRIHDYRLVCWHLPAEKRFGIRRTATKLMADTNVVTWPVHKSRKWHQFNSQLGINRNSIFKIILDTARSIQDRILM